MTANDTTPPKGKDSIEIGEESYPLRKQTDEEIARELEKQKQEVRQAVDDVDKALLNDSIPLTDEKVHRVAVAADALNGLVRTLSLRVPEEHRAE